MIYVTMTDKHMSGWGMAKGRTNKLVFECADMAEAKAVEENARCQGSMIYVNICSRKPYYSPSRYYAQTKTKEEYPSWYVPGYFARRA